MKIPPPLRKLLGMSPEFPNLNTTCGFTFKLYSAVFAQKILGDLQQSLYKKDIWGHSFDVNVPAENFRCASINFQNGRHAKIETCFVGEIRGKEKHMWEVVIFSKHAADSHMPKPIEGADLYFVGLKSFAADDTNGLSNLFRDLLLKPQGEIESDREITKNPRISPNSQPQYYGNTLIPIGPITLDAEGRMVTTIGGGASVTSSANARVMIMG